MQYGWKPDIPDRRDFRFKNLRSININSLPEFIDLRPYCSKVENQFSLGSCTGNAIVGNLELLINKTNSEFIDLSRLFVYYNERKIEGTIQYDSGAMLRDGIKSLIEYGVCSESLFPYDISKFRDEPSSICYEEAKTRRISQYMRLDTLPEMLQCLADGFPFVFGFAVYSNFESHEMARTGILTMPNIGDKMNGGHAVLACGYDMKTKQILVRNSWGESWGQKGYFWMPFDYVEDRNLSDDFWTIRK